MTDARSKIKRRLSEIEEILDQMFVCADAGQQVKNDAPMHVRENYTLVLEDIFKGQTELDLDKWTTELVWTKERLNDGNSHLTINQEEQFYVSLERGEDQIYGNPFSFGPDGLRITASPIQGTKPQTLGGLVGGQNYISGVMNTRESVSIKGGYYEVCMKPPCLADGSWPAAWLLNTNYYNNAFDKNAAENGGVGNDKFEPEIDHPEFVTGGSNTGTTCAKSAYHYFTGDRLATEENGGTYYRWTADASGFRGNPRIGSTILSGIYERCDGSFASVLPETCTTDFCQDFHTFGVDWEPNNYIHYYVDGVLRNCINGANNIISDQLMYLIINFAVGGTFPFGNPVSQQADPSSYPATLEVEYARLYQR